MILFRDKEGKREYLVLRRKGGDRYWGFAKGTPEERETEIQTGIREAKEETNLKTINLVEGYKEAERYYFEEDEENYDKTVIFFLGKVLDDFDGNVSKEHEKLRWLKYEDALNLITHDNDKALLKKAEEKITSQK